MNIIESLEWRYACKKFDPSKKLTNTQIDTLKNAFNLTPTSFGLQPIKMIVIKEQKLKDKFFPHSYFQEQVKTCSHLLVLCIDTIVDEKTIDNYFDYEKKVRGTTEDVVGTFRKQLKGMYGDMTAEDIERSSVYQTYIALGNLMTVCAVEKIDNCPMEGFVPAKIDEILGLKEKNLKSVLMLPVGIRAEDDIMSGMKKVRKPLKDIVIEL
ncbi:MAG: NAD(P)H-dependent oxidoreductase [Bacteroidetes bacterium]|nr:MAG: NAD(P)H-dependent oxidoreductase [Bacteroidota bacterium]